MASMKAGRVHILLGFALSIINHQASTTNQDVNHQPSSLD
jgi:hypothetical protein